MPDGIRLQRGTTFKVKGNIEFLLNKTVASDRQMNSPKKASIPLEVTTRYPNQAPETISNRCECKCESFSYSGQ